MGTLRYMPAAADDTGEEVEYTDSGHRRQRNGILIGNGAPQENGEIWYDDPKFPNGTIDDSGTIVPDKVTE